MSTRNVRVSGEVADWLLELAVRDRQAAVSALGAISAVAYSTTTNRLGMLVHDGYAVLYELDDDQQTVNVTACRPVPRGYPPMM